MTRPIRFTLAICAASLGCAGEASAHAHLQTATPAMGGTVAAAPAALGLVFSEGVNPRFSGIAVTGPASTTVPTGPARLAPSGDRMLVVPLEGPLGPGLYRVDWHALATDGHKTQGSYTFTIAP